MLLSITYPLICTLIPCTVYQLLTVRKLENKNHLFRHMIWVYIFLLYINLVFSVTGIGTVWEIGIYGEIIRTNEINLIPFRNGIEVGDVLNAIMFMPLGFLLPLIWESLRNIFKVILTGVGFSLVIELSQLLNRRITDSNDLLMNAMGALLGYIVWIVFKRIFKKSGEKSIILSKNEPIFYLLLAFSGNFILFNWRLLIKVLDAIQ